MYNLKIIKCGKRLEVYRYNGYTVRSNEEKVIGEVFDDIPEDKCIDPKDKQEISEYRRQKTLNTARNNIIRMIRCNEDDLKVFLTLTFAEESNYKDSKVLLNNFFNKLRRSYKGLKYIWIMEFGTLKGRLHFHVLCNVPVNIKLSISKEKKSQEHKALEEYFRLKYWEYGWVDIRKLDDEGCDNVALYVAAYLTKDLIDKKFEGYRVYGYSHKTLDRPEMIKEYTTESLESIIEKFSSDYRVTYSNSYEIGYTSFNGEYKGTVSYLDLVQRED